MKLLSVLYLREMCPAFAIDLGCIRRRSTEHPQNIRNGSESAEAGATSAASAVA